MRLHVNALIGFLLLPACACPAQEIELQAKLLNRVGTETSRPGGPVSAPGGQAISLAAEVVRLDPGSRVTLAAKSRSGPALITVSAAAAPAPVPAAGAPASPLAAAPARSSEPVPQATAPAPSSGQPDLTAVKADFIPGEKVIFYDDFSGMAGDEPPPHWKVRGKTELRTGQGVRQLTMPEGGTELTANLNGLTKNFTMEADLKFENVGSAYGTWCFLKKDRYKAMCLKLSALRVDSAVTVELVTGDPREQAELAGRGVAKVDFSQPVRQALWAQNGRLRVYINGERIVDANQIELDPITSVRFEVGLDDTPKTAFGLRRVRFAESTPDFGSIISSTGRYVTHGILFDTDSDRIRPESAPVIKLVARACETNPNLRLLIEGHTDSTGDANHNVDLSKRRAEAVKAVLTSQFNVEPGRLTTAGLGAAKPIDSNDTPAGRAQNRRVEFTRQ